MPIDNLIPCPPEKACVEIAKQNAGDLIDEDTEEKKKYQIGGDVEADVKSGKIALSSPIARALIGKGEGDSIEVIAPGGARSYEIAKIKYG